MRKRFDAMMGGRPAAVMLTTGLSSACGGPFFSVSGLAAAVDRSGLCDAAVVGTYSHTAAWPQDRCRWNRTDLVAIPGKGLRSTTAIASAAEEMIDSGLCRGRRRLVHVSGLWDAASLAGSLLQNRGVPCVISPRGMLEPWSLQHKAWKKRLAMFLWQRRLLASSGLLHATASSELASIRNLGLRTPVCVIPNGIDFPPDAVAMRADESSARTAGRPKTAVFLSRIHPKKGLPLLLRAWAAVRPPNWSLQIAGIAEDKAHEADVRQMVRALDLDAVSLVGERSGDAKWEFLRSADLFVLPSYSENFGIVVAEAMACGLPAISTTGTPWQALRDEAMGWWVEPTADGLATALAEACLQSDLERHRRGERARVYAHRHFGWDEIGRRMARCYHWALGLGPPTEDIVFA